MEWIVSEFRTDEAPPFKLMHHCGAGRIDLKFDAGFNRVGDRGARPVHGAGHGPKPITVSVTGSTVQVPEPGAWRGRRWCISLTLDKCARTEISA